MPEDTTVVDDTTTPTVEEPVEVPETPAPAPVVDPAEKAALEAKNRQLFERTKKAEADAKAARAEAEALKKNPSALDVEDYIDISAALDGLDQREKKYLAEQHKLTGKPLSELRNDENFVLWQSAYHQKVEKENSVKPSGTQPESPKPKTLGSALAESNDLASKEEMLRKAGLYKDPGSPRNDRVILGPQN